MSQELTLKVKKAVVLVDLSGTDEIHLVLDSPTPYPELGYEATAKIHVASGYGAVWCREVLGLEAELISCK